MTGLMVTTVTTVDAVANGKAQKSERKYEYKTKQEKSCTFTC